jgi:hypothetical protein
MPASSAYSDIRVSNGSLPRCLRYSENSVTASKSAICNARRGLASEHQTRPDQEGVPGGTLRIVALDGFVVGACPRKCGFLLMAGQVRRECELLEIVETERRSGVRRRELRVRVAP